MTNMSVTKNQRKKTPSYLNDGIADREQNLLRSSDRVLSLVLVREPAVTSMNCD